MLKKIYLPNLFIFLLLLKD